MPRIIVALNVPKGDNDFIAYAKHVATCMTSNPWFPSPPVAMTTFSAHIAEVDAAQVATLTHARGATTDRDAKLAVVHDDLRQLRTYVETVANQHPQDALVIIASGGMSPKETKGPSKEDFAAKQGKTAGSVILTVRHPGVSASFEWRSSVDGVVWVDRGRTMVAHQEIEGLVPGTRYDFQYRTLTTEGLTDWSDSVSLMVV